MQETNDKLNKDENGELQKLIDLMKPKLEYSQRTREEGKDRFVMDNKFICFSWSTGGVGKPSKNNKI